MIEVAPPVSPQEYQSALLLAAAKVLYNEETGAPAPLEQTARLMKSADVEVLRQDGTVKGMIAYRIDAVTDVATIEAVAASRDSRRLGYGRVLVEHVENIATRRGVGSVVLKSLPGAVAFYQHLGYTRRGSDEFLFGKSLR
jgi:ribosomal protein S18 acetylase RimI-like enzyme